MKVKQILEGIKIVDFTQVMQGPLATQMLADFGADVIKIERPGMGDWSRGYGPYAKGLSLVSAGLNRNKRSFALDVRKPEGKEIIYRLLQHADVLVHNFRPGVDKKLGLDYESLKKINPQIIHAHSSGWGDKGPYVEKKRKGHAELAAAAAGLYRARGKDDLPQPAGMSVDYPAGLLLALGILLALFEREKSGMGQEVSTDLLSAAIFAQIWISGETLNPQFSEIKDNDLGATESSLRYSWRTKDGYIEVSPVFSPDALKDLSAAMELGDLSHDERFNTSEKRIQNQPELDSIIEKRFLEKTTDEWLDIFESSGVLSTKINDFSSALQDPQVKANDMILEMKHDKIGTLRLLGNPIRFSRTLAQMRITPPYLGEQTEEVLKELGYSEKEIASLKKKQVIA